jgi:hypothetical protein
MRKPRHPDDVDITSNTLSHDDRDHIGKRVSHALHAMRDLGVTPRDSELDDTELYDLTATVASYEHPRKQIGVAVNGDSLKKASVIPVAAATHAKAHGDLYSQPQLAELQNWNTDNTYQSRKNKVDVGKTLFDATTSDNPGLIAQRTRLKDYQNNGGTKQSPTPPTDMNK